MGIKFSRGKKSGSSWEVDDPLIFGLAAAGVGFGLLAFLRAKVSVESKIQNFISFSDFYKLLSAGSIAAVTLHSTEGGAIASFQDAGRTRLAELPPDGARLVTEAALSSGITLSADTGVVGKQLAVIGELVGYSTALLGAALFLKITGPKNFAKNEIHARGAKTFEDVAGLEKTKIELMEIVEYIKSPETFDALGARPPRGVLLEGPSGTGKTLLGRAIAGEAGVQFMYVAASQFIEVFVGQGARAVRETFQQARANAPCVLFIDELDAVGLRTAGGGAGSQEHVQTINQLLVELDAVNNGDAMVVVLAATNRFDALDEALVRPGRFDRLVHVGYPDEKAREHAFRIHSRNLKIAGDVNLAKLARMTDTWTGADIEATLNSAALASARAKKPFLEMDSILETINDLKKEKLQRRARAGESGETSNAFVKNFFSQMLRKPDVTTAD